MAVPETPLPPAAELLVRQAEAATDRSGQLRALTQLTRANPRHGAGIYRALSAIRPDGPRLALEFVTRYAGKVSRDLIRTALPALADKAIPIPVRIAAAGAMLAAVPDDPRSVTPIVRAVTAGLSRSRVLERMLQLQSRVEKCAALDALVAASEAKVRLRCPKCPARLTRRDLIQHLWHHHRLVFEHGTARDPRSILDETITATAASADPHEVDRTFLLTEYYYPDAPPHQVLQALAARSDDPTPTDRLLGHVRGDHAGLCPVCLNAVPDPIPPLPPPAEVSDGRVSAGGYEARVEDPPLGRVYSVGSPGDTPAREPETGPRRSPRLVATLAAFPLFLLAMVAAIAIPDRFANPIWVAVWFSAVAWLAYVAVRLIRKPLRDRTERALELAWHDLAPGAGRSPEAVRFLTRLCRASLASRQAPDRRNEVFQLAQQSAVLGMKGGSHAQLHAAVRLLEVFDAARLGREKMPGLVELFTHFLRGDATLGYAEAAAEMVLAPGVLSAGDSRRLGVFVVASAFELGWLPPDLVTLGRFAPQFRKLILNARPDHIGFLYAVWRGREARPWSAAGEASSIFELVAEAAADARTVLADHPDAILRIHFPGEIEAVLGTVLVTARGVAIADRAVSDPAAAVETVRTPGGWRLQFGPHRFTLEGKLPDRAPESLRAWVKLWADKLSPAATQTAGRGTGKRVVSMLAPLAVACPLCGMQSVVRTGRVGTPWQAIVGG
jgi:hypothetical protein